MNSKHREILARYGVALAAMAAAVCARWLLNPVLGNRMPLVALYGAVTVAVWFGGAGPGVIAAVLGYVATVLLFVEAQPGTPLSLTSAAGITGLIVYLLSCLVVIGLGNRMRSAQRASAAAALDALNRQKELESAVAAAEAAKRQLQIVTDSIPAPVTRCSCDFRYVWANEAYAELIGRRQEEIAGHAIVEVIGEEAFERLLPHFRQILSGERVEYEGNVKFQSIGVRSIRAVYTRTTGADGAVDGWVAVVIDITNYKQLEDALRKTNQRKDEFLAMLAHELRNPLAPVRNAVEIMRRHGRPTPEIASAIEVIDRQTQQMTRLIDDLLNISRINRDRLALRKEHVELAKVLAGTVETSQPLMTASGQQLSVALPSDPVWLDADATRLIQVFSNLLNNASKFSEPGSRIRLTAERQGGQVAVSVCDEGIGIPPEDLPGVFDKFTQADRSLERTRGGLGLGLALAKRLVEMHGGSIEARSDGAGMGSEFSVRLPVTAAHDVPQPRLAVNGELPAAPARRRILVADDNEDAATTLGMLLGDLGYETREVYDGLKALEAAGEFRPDVALLDIGMPRLNGYDLARRIHEQPWGRDIILIALSGWGQAEDRQRSLEVGFEHYLVKPVDPHDLAKLLASVAAR